MKNKLFGILSEVLFWVALRVSRVSSRLYAWGGRCWQRSPEGEAQKWADDMLAAARAINHPDLAEISDKKPRRKRRARK